MFCLISQAKLPIIQNRFCLSSPTRTFRFFSFLKSKDFRQRQICILYNCSYFVKPKERNFYIFFRRSLSCRTGPLNTGVNPTKLKAYVIEFKYRFCCSRGVKKVLPNSMTQEYRLSPVEFRSFSSDQVKMSSPNPRLPKTFQSLFPAIRLPKFENLGKMSSTRFWLSPFPGRVSRFGPAV